LIALHGNTTRAACFDGARRDRPGRVARAAYRRRPAARP
jgi:hypothetical protein